MKIKLRQTAKITFNNIRESWMNDPEIKKFLSFNLDSKIKNQDDSSSLFFEIYLQNHLIGDIKVFSSEHDKDKKVAEILMIIGENRGKGIGTAVIGELLNILKTKFQEVYCKVNRYNLPSIKMLRKNGFRFSDLSGSDFILRKKLC